MIQEKKQCFKLKAVAILRDGAAFDWLMSPVGTISQFGEREEKQNFRLPPQQW